LAFFFAFFFFAIVFGTICKLGCRLPQSEAFEIFALFRTMEPRSEKYF
jgi:hypothetical protein